MNTRTLFFLGIVVAASGLLSPPLALMQGLCFGLFFTHPLPEEAGTLSRFLLQASVVALGFGMDFDAVMRAGRSGLLYTALGIVAAMAIGLFLGRVLNVSRMNSYLITAGTSICGGSAIAAVAPVAHANQEEVGVSLGTVFTLNAMALLLFPAVGHTLGLTQIQFGLWSALAIHDTSSVVGATAKYGPTALAVGTAVKLARALWIIPLSLVTAAWTSSRNKNLPAGASERRKAPRVHIPWFIALFLLAALLHVWLPQYSSSFKALDRLGHTGMIVTLFLIGSSISRSTLRQVGIRPFVQGTLLWIIVAGISLVLIRSGLVHL